MSEENQAAAQPNLADDLATIKQQLAAVQQTAQASNAYMEGIQKAASGHVEPVQKAPHETFVDNILSKGDAPVRSVVQEELQRRAYFDTLANTFKKENPHLEPVTEEIFGMTNGIVQSGAAKGQHVSYEEALKQARDHYDGKQKRMMAISGANRPPAGSNGYPNSRYAGVEKDLFALTDAEFMAQEMKPRDDARRRRQREAHGNY